MNDDEKLFAGLVMILIPVAFLVLAYLSAGLRVYVPMWSLGTLSFFGGFYWLTQRDTRSAQQRRRVR